jgi:hypothetical protein
MAEWNLSLLEFIMCEDIRAIENHKLVHPAIRVIYA